MKNYLKTCLVCLGMAPGFLYAQCAPNTQAKLKWDNIDYYYNSGPNNAPYGYNIPVNGNYVTNAMEITQKFAIGTTYVTIALPVAGIVKGENATHTGDLANYTGEDAQFTPTANGQVMTLTFGKEVLNASFTLYDVDNLANFTITANNNANTALNVNATPQLITGLLVLGSGTTSANVSHTLNTNQANNSNSGSVTISVAGPVKTITITMGTIGGDATFWMSDILICDDGVFPINYHQLSGQPFTGPAGNQPDYFLVTPDNNSVYMMDPATSKAYFLFTDPEKQYINSLGYDPVNHLIYYVAEAFPATATNKKLKRYDVLTGTITTVTNDISALLNIPTFSNSLESGGGCFYNGSLYLGAEGGQFSAASSREHVVYKIDFDASLNPINAAQVWATPTYNSGGTFLVDWGDFIIKNGIFYGFNTRPGNTIVSYWHTDLMSAANTKYLNPGNTTFAGQSGMDWAGNMYSFFSTGLAKYNGNGTNAATVAITLPGGTWPGGAGDCSESFRPPADFGDAPATYDPVATSVAVHDQDPLIRLGAGFDREWTTKGQTALANSDNFDDALAYVPTFNPVTGAYIAQASVFNNTGAPATLCAWLDYNGDGDFDAAEGITMSIPTNAANQTVWIYIPGIVSPLANGSFTYLRIRIVRSTTAMTVSNPTGWYNNGEVEDYRVRVDNFPLAVQNYNFDAQLTRARTVALDWNVTDETNVASYIVEKSSNGADWQLAGGTGVKSGNGAGQYQVIDNAPYAGSTYYRLKILLKDGTFKISTVQKVDNKTNRFSVMIAPNPAITTPFVYISSDQSSVEIQVQLINAAGAVVHQQKLLANKGTNAIKLSAADNLPAGRYIVKVSTGSETYSESLIIKK